MLHGCAEQTELQSRSHTGDTGNKAVIKRESQGRCALAVGVEVC